MYVDKKEVSDYELFVSVWGLVLDQAENNPDGFVKGVEDYVYPNDLPNLTTVYTEHISKMVGDEKACLIYASGERFFFKWCVMTLEGAIWFSDKNLCLLPDGKVLKFD